MNRTARVRFGRWRRLEIRIRGTQAIDAAAPHAPRARLPTSRRCSVAAISTGSDGLAMHASRRFRPNAPKPFPRTSSWCGGKPASGDEAHSSPRCTRRPPRSRSGPPAQGMISTYSYTSQSVIWRRTGSVARANQAFGSCLSISRPMNFRSSQIGSTTLAR